MCGIFGYIGKRTNAANVVFEGIKTLEYRGYDSWGVAAISKTGIFVQKQVGKIGDAKLHNPPKSSLAIAHTRWATHGGVTQENAHPHLDCTKSIAIIHNGIIENYDILKKQIHLRHTFLSETDSEVAAHMIEVNVHTMPFSEAVRKTFLACSGSNALVAIHRKTNELVAIRNGSPLVIGFGKNEQFVASDTAGLLPYTKNVYFLEDNEMAILTTDTVTIKDSKTNTIKKITPTKLSWSKTSTNLNGFSTFMEKELHEQPLVLKRIISDHSYTTMLSHAIHSAKGAYLIGCGSAYYACLAGTYLFSTIAKRHINATVASEFTYQEDFIKDTSLIIALSQSGETMDLIDAVKRAKAKGATIGSIVNVEGSTLARLSNFTIPCGAGPEMAVASTKDLTAKLAHLVLTSYACIDNLKEGTIMLTKAHEEITRICSPSSKQKLLTITQILCHTNHLFVVGRGLSYPAALEIAMKIKEITYIHAEGLAAGELKHGTIALIEKGTPCIVLAPNDETHGANIAAAMELAARGAIIIGISHLRQKVFDHFIEVKDCGPATIIPTIVAGQLLALAITKEKGLDPDKPRNLAKSVTVK